MNRIFKVIWSKSKNCFVVTSELAKNHTGKTKRVTSRKLVEKTMAVTMAVMGLMQMTLPMVSASFVTTVPLYTDNETLPSGVPSIMYNSGEAGIYGTPGIVGAGSQQTINTNIAPYHNSGNSWNAGFGASSILDIMGSGGIKITMGSIPSDVISYANAHQANHGLAGGISDKSRYLAITLDSNTSTMISQAATQASEAQSNMNNVTSNVSSIASKVSMAVTNVSTAVAGVSTTVTNVSNTVTNVSNTVQSNASAIDSVSKVARAHTVVSNADANITIGSTVDSTTGAKVYNVGLNSNVTAASLSTTQQAASNPLGSYNTESYLDGSGLQIKGVQNGVSNVTTLSDGSLRMTGSGYSTDSVTGEPLAPGYTNNANYTSAGMKTTETTADGRQNTFQTSPGGINIYDSRHSGDVNHSDNSTQITATGLKIANSTGAKNEISNTGINVTSADGNTVTKMADTGLTATNSTTGDKTEINQTGISITNTINTSTSQVSLTGQGLNNGGNRITNVDTGVSTTDAVNVGQLNSHIDSVKNIISNVSNTVTNVSNTVVNLGSTISNISNTVINVSNTASNALAEAGKHTTVKSADSNITVTSNLNENGSMNYNVGLNSNLTTTISNNASGIASTIASLSNVSSSLTNTISNVSSSLNNVSSSLSNVNSSLSNVSSSLTSTISNVSSSLTSGINSNASVISNVNSSLSNVSSSLISSISSNRSGIASNAQRISNLESTTSNVSSSLTSTISTLSNVSSSLTSGINSNASAISNVNSSLSNTLR